MEREEKFMAVAGTSFTLIGSIVGFVLSLIVVLTIVIPFLRIRGFGILLKMIITVISFVAVYAVLQIIILIAIRILSAIF